jgi:hypothetical protein
LEEHREPGDPVLRNIGRQVRADEALHSRDQLVLELAAEI